MLRTSRILRLLMSTLDGPKYEPSSLVPLRYSYVISTCTSLQRAHSMQCVCALHQQDMGSLHLPKGTSRGCVAMETHRQCMTSLACQNWAGNMPTLRVAMVRLASFGSLSSKDRTWLPCSMSVTATVTCTCTKGACVSDRQVHML